MATIYGKGWKIAVENDSDGLDCSEQARGRIH